MKKINVKQLINEKVRVKFIDNDLEEGWFVRDKFHNDMWSVLSLNDTRSVSFRKSHIKTITWLSNNQVLKYDEIDFEE